MKVSLGLVERRDEADDVTSFLFEADQHFGQQAGQHVRLTVPHDDVDSRGISRYFTISSVPAEPNLMITTRLSERGSSFKRALSSLPIGATVEAVGPGGRFVYPPEQPPALFIAGGIGITPIRAILVDAAERFDGLDAVVLYANRSVEFPFRACLDELTAARSQVKVIYTVTRPPVAWRGHVGRIDRAFIDHAVTDLARRVVYVSGPQPMVEATVGALVKLGVEVDRIKQEIFPGYES